MAFWKIYSKQDTKNHIAIVDGKDNIYKYFRDNIPNVRNIEERTFGSFSPNNWYVFQKGGSDFYKDAIQFYTVQYKPTDKELEKLRPKKKYQPLPKKTIDIKVGDIYYTSWGYEQTNIDWIVITGVSPTGKTVTAKMTKAKTGENLGSHDRVFPTKSTYGDNFRLQVRENGSGDNITYSIIGSYPFLDGKIESSTRMGYFHKYNKGDTVTETNSYYQH